MKNNFVRLAFVALSCVAVPAFSQNVATVNGKAIPSSRLENIVKELVSHGQKDTPELRQMVRNDLIMRELMLQEANRQGLQKRPSVKNEIELNRQKVLIETLQGDYIKAHPVTDEEIKKAYEDYKTKAGKTEYKASHILVAKEDEAKDVITKLKDGESFEELAKKVSIDKGTAQKGGDLGWSNPAQLVPPFAESMVKMEKGKYTETPVKTEYGYHVIKVDDTRPYEVPELDKMKPQFYNVLVNQRLISLQESLIKKAKIK